jgi:hypothetical protein
VSKCVLLGMNYLDHIGDETTATPLPYEVDRGKSRVRTPASDFVKRDDGYHKCFISLVGQVVS